MSKRNKFIIIFKKAAMLYGFILGTELWLKSLEGRPILETCLFHLV